MPSEACSVLRSPQLGERWESVGRSALPDQIPAALGAHLCRMDGTRRDVTPSAHPECLRPAVDCQSHLAAQNDVRGLGLVSVFGIRRVRPILPNVGVAKSFGLQFFRQLGLVHSRILHCSGLRRPRQHLSLCALLFYFDTFSPPNTVTPLPH